MVKESPGEGKARVLAKERIQQQRQWIRLRIVDLGGHQRPGADGDPCCIDFRKLRWTDVAAPKDVARR